MKRGDIYTVSGGRSYTGKPRPAVIVQDDAFDATQSVTICPFTSDATAAPLLRLPVEPDVGNGLRQASHLMVDKLTTVPRARLGKPVGRLGDKDVLRLNRAMGAFLGLGTPARTRRAR